MVCRGVCWSSPWLGNNIISINGNENTLSPQSQKPKRLQTMLDLASHTIPVFGIVFLVVLYVMHQFIMTNHSKGNRNCDILIVLVSYTNWRWQESNICFECSMISGIALPLFISKYPTCPFPSILIISYLSTALVLVLPCWLNNAIRQILFSFLAHQILSTSIIHLCSLLYIILLNCINFSLISYNNEYINLKCIDHHLHQADQESK